MNVDITAAEREFLLEILEARQTSMLHELHHTDTLDYKELLERKMKLLEALKEKVSRTA